MTDEPTTNPSDSGGSSRGPADETFGWTAEQQGGGSNRGREWVAQLQAMIENLAEQATPVIREVGAKAAELAALAGDKAGPAAHKAAEFTAEAGQKIASRSRDLAAELRRDQAAGTPSAEATGIPTDETIAGDAP